MPLYELFVISKSAPQVPNKLRSVMKETAEILMNTGSQVRKIEFLGHKPLPYRMKHRESYCYDGSNWLIQFFGSPLINEQIREKLKFNDEIIRYTLVKKADSLKHYIRP